MKEEIKKLIGDSLEVKKLILEKNVDDIREIAGILISAYRKNNKVLICGNGGSAGDSQHFAGELVCRFEKERKALFCIALTTDTSILTALANDYSFDVVFKRQVEALASPGDVLIGISTSGNAANVISAVQQAKKQGVTTIGFTGQDGGKLKPFVDKCLCVPSKTTARIQEGHIMIIHILCRLIEQELFK